MPPDSEASPVLARSFAVDRERAGTRLDRFVAITVPDFTRARAQKMIESGQITVNRAPSKAGMRLKEGDEVTVEPLAARPVSLLPTPIPLSVIYEDNDVLVIDKPAGLVVHPAPGHSSDTLVNALLARYPSLQGGLDLRPGIVHRLDRDTSGLMVIAKNDRAMASLKRQMKERAVVKEYLVLVDGIVQADQGVIEAPIGRDPAERKRMAVVESGREARSHFAVLERLAVHTFLKVRLETGRTHQIRVHLASIGHPVEGDRVYGRYPAHCPALKRQFLHAARLGFALPAGKHVTFQSELPEDLRQCMAELRR